MNRRAFLRALGIGFVAGWIAPAHARFPPGSSGPPSPNAIVYSVAYNGDIQRLAPGGSILSLVWSGGPVPATTASPHGLVVGSLAQIVLNHDVDISGYYGTFDCQIMGASTFTYA